MFDYRINGILHHLTKEIDLQKCLIDGPVAM